ncbi:hypothetical protein NAV31_18945 [Pseudomonas stutzeri]|nr:hypothetical protein [Stutzerimonas degradans]
MYSDDRIKKVIELAFDAVSDTPILNEEFSANGWCLPLDNGMVELYHYTVNSKLSKTESMALFYANKFEEIIEPELRRESLLLVEPHNTMLDECIKSYRCSYYSICIPALFSIIESMLVFLSNKGDFKQLKYSSSLNLRIAKSSHR